MFLVVELSRPWVSLPTSGFWIAATLYVGILQLQGMQRSFSRGRPTLVAVANIPSKANRTCVRACCRDHTAAEGVLAKAVMSTGSSQASAILPRPTP